MRQFIISILLLNFSIPAVAQDVSPVIQHAAGDTASRVEIVEDQKIGAFRFMIDGQEMARLDAAGLHVRKSIELGGTLTDTGTAYFDNYIRQESSE